MLNKLTHQEIAALVGRDKPFKLFDGGGLYVEVTPTHVKRFGMKSYFEGREVRLAFGAFPQTSLKRARERRDEIRRQISRGIDPRAARAATKAARQQQTDTFEAVAREWYQTRKTVWAKSHASKVIGRLELHVFPSLGSLPVASISAADLLKCMRRIEQRGWIETAHRTLNVCTRVLAYAIVTQRASVNPARELGLALKTARVRHHPTIIEPKKIGQLLRAIVAYDGSEVTRHALRLAALLFVRPGELRHAEWSEFQLDDANPEWRIPASKMKMRGKHIVPLAAQSVALLKCLKSITGHGKFLFPSLRSKDRPMSENTVNAALRNMGYEKNEMTGHGFRAMASTLLHEQGFPSDAIERQLAHSERNKVKDAYCHADFLPKRREMMQAWANYLDELKEEPHE